MQRHRGVKVSAQLPPDIWQCLSMRRTEDRAEVKLKGVEWP